MVSALNIRTKLNSIVHEKKQAGAGTSMCTIIIYSEIGIKLGLVSYVRIV
jgi:hypothetical protein